METVRMAVIYDRKNKANAHHCGIIEIRVTYRRKMMYVSTGINVYPNQWDRRALMVYKRLDADVMNRKVKATMERIEKAVEIVKEQGEFSLDLLRAAMGERKGGDDPLKWIAEMIERRPLTETTKRHHRSTLKLVRSTGLFKSWGDMNLSNIERYDEAVRKRVHAVATIACYHKQFRVYLGEAVRHGLLKDNPYRFFKIKRPDDTASIRYLTEEERSLLEECKLEGALAKVRDLWLFCSYTGLSYSDMAKLKREDIVKENGKMMIVDRRQKTASQYKIVLLPKAIEILERYDWQLPTITNQKCNYFLKIIGPGAKLDKRLTMHMARHTFATWALSRGVRIEVVSKMLAHSDIKTTQLYAKVMQREVEKGYELLE